MEYEYLKEVPMIIRNALKTLSDDKTLSTFLILYNEGEKSRLTLRKLLNLSNKELDKIIDKLEFGGLVRQFVYSLNDLGNDDKTFCEVTVFGKILWSNILNSINKGMYINISDNIVNIDIERIVDLELRGESLELR